MLKFNFAFLFESLFLLRFYSIIGLKTNHYLYSQLG